MKTKYYYSAEAEPDEGCHRDLAAFGNARPLEIRARHVPLSI
jgi:hypothetical protein